MIEHYFDEAETDDRAARINTRGMGRKSYSIVRGLLLYLKTACIKLLAMYELAH